MGGTLAYGEPDFWGVFIETCRKHGHAVTLDDINEVKAEVDPVFRSRQFLTRERLEIYPVRRYQMILEGLGVDDAAPIVGDVQETMGKVGGVHLYPEVKDVLAGLQDEGMYLGIISNTTCLLEEGCRNLGIWEFFEIILASDLLLSKPQDMMFKIAIEESGASGDSCLHVGDSYNADYLGARDAGMRAVLLDRQGTSHRDCPTVRDLTGIGDFLT